MNAPQIPPAAPVLLPLRVRHHAEMNRQIAHDSICRREGWARSYLLEPGGIAVGFGSVAIAGPWENRPRLFSMGQR